MLAKPGGLAGRSFAGVIRFSMAALTFPGPPVAAPRVLQGDPVARPKKGDEGVDIRVKIPAKKSLDETTGDGPEDPERREDVRRDTEGLLREAGQGAMAEIERTDQQTGRTFYCGTAPAKQVTRDYCVQHFGGGDYLVTVKVPTKTGSLKYFQRVKFSIDPAVKPTAPLTPGGGVASPDAGGLGIYSALQGFLTQQLEATAAYHRMNMEVFEGRKSWDWKPFIPVLVAVVEAYSTRRPGRDPVELALKMMRELRPDGEAGAGGGLDGVLAQVETIRKLKAAFGGDAVDAAGDPVLSVANRALGVFERVLEERRAAGVVAGGRRAVAAPAAPLPDDGAPVQVEDMPRPAPSDPPAALVRLDAPWARELASQLSDVPRYSLFAPPEAAAAIVFENMTPGSFQALGDELRSELAGGRTLERWRDRVLPLLAQPDWAPEVRDWFSDALLDLAYRFAPDVAAADAAAGPLPGEAG